MKFSLFPFLSLFISAISQEQCFNNTCTNNVTSVSLFPDPTFINSSVPVPNYNYSQKSLQINLVSGWNLLPFVYVIQQPWNLSLNTRYAEKIVNYTLFQDFLVYSNDPPLANGSTTMPRTEGRYLNQEMYNGTYAFTGYFRIDQNTSGVIFFQIFGLTLQLRSYNCNLYNLNVKVSSINICNSYHFLNVTYDATMQTYQLNGASQKNACPTLQNYLQ